MGYNLNQNNGWTLETALNFIREFNEGLATEGYHVGLTGSVLFSGASTKDLDLIIYPRKKDKDFVPNIHSVMEQFPLKVISFYQCTNATSKRYRDDKLVIACYLEHNLRVDLFFLS